MRAFDMTRLVLRILLLLTVLTPLAVASHVVFPFVFGKVLIFRGLVGLALTLFAGYVLWGILKRKSFASSFAFGQVVQFNAIRNPLFLSIVLFFLSFAASTFFAVNMYRAFWGDLERGEGLFGFLYYGAFLVLSLLVFERRDWIMYFRLALCVGVILIFYAVLQYVGVAQFPFARPPAERPGSLVGNPAFLATHMIFLVIFSGIVFSSAARNTFWRYAAVTISVLSLGTLFLTGTRGAILGVGAGALVALGYFVFRGGTPSLMLGKARVSYRAAAASILFLTFLFACVFWFSRSAPLWQNIPGLDRLARTAISDVRDPSTHTRLLTWKISWEAFKEKPLLGWGPENYLMAWQAHYDPDLALYGETWLDRAHNKVLDMLVMQGLFGLASYVALFAVLLYMGVKIGKETMGVHGFVPIFLAGMTAYAVQNLVLFDQIVSYTTLFALLGFVIAENSPNSRSLASQGGAAQEQNSALLGRIFCGIFSLGVAVFSLYLLYAYHLIPFAQAKAFQKSPGLGDVHLMVEKLGEAFYPYNYAQYTLRSHAYDAVYRDQFFYNDEYRTNPEFKSLVEFWEKIIEELVQKEPYDVRVFIRGIEMYDALGRDDERYYKKGEELIRKALLRSPNRQELYYHLALNLVKQGRIEDALAAVEKSIDLSPGVARAHFHYGLVLTAAGRDAEGQAELAKAEELNPTFDGFFPSDLNTLMLLYSSWGQNDKIAELALRSAERMLAGGMHVFPQKYYEIAFYYYLLEEDTERFVKIAEMLGKLGGLEEDMAVFIDLARNGRWQIIKNSIIIE